MRRPLPSAGLLRAVLAGTAAALASSTAAPAQQPPARPTTIGGLQQVAALTGDQPAGIAVSLSGRLFVTFPRHDGAVAFTVAEIKGGRPSAYPSSDLNDAKASDPAGTLHSVQTLLVDGADHLWMLDTGTLRFGEPPVPGAPKLVEVDLARDMVVRTIVLPPDALAPNSALKDFRLDLHRGPAGTAFITDSAPGQEAIVVADLATGRAMRRLVGTPAVTAEGGRIAVVGGEPLLVWPTKPTRDGNPRPWSVGLNAIEISEDGKTLFFSAFTTGRLLSVGTDVLSDRNADDRHVASQVVDVGQVAVAGHFCLDANGRLYFMDMERDEVFRRTPDGRVQAVVADPRLIWPDTMAIGPDQYLYVTTSQNDRRAEFHDGEDLRRQPYGIYRVFIGSGAIRPSR